MNHRVLLEDGNRKLSLVGLGLLQIQIEQDDQEAYIDLNQDEAYNLVTQITEFLKKNDYKSLKRSPVIIDHLVENVIIINTESNTDFAALEAQVSEALLNAIKNIK